MPNNILVPLIVGVLVVLVLLSANASYPITA
jgi:hypothetical protein